MFNEGVADRSLHLGYRSTYQNKCFGMYRGTRAAQVKSRWFNHLAALSKTPCLACNLLAEPMAEVPRLEELGPRRMCFDGV